MIQVRPDKANPSRAQAMPKGKTSSRESNTATKPPRIKLAPSVWQAKNHIQPNKTQKPSLAQAWLMKTSQG